MLTNRKFNLLVVDDQSDTRDLFAFALREAGYNVRGAVDGLDAMRLIHEQRPDLIITDVRMPNMDGFELIRTVRADVQMRFTPILIQTAAATSIADLVMGSEAGALSYLVSPDISVMLARVKTLLEFKEHLDALTEAANTDVLTGLANRRRFEAFMHREASRFTRSRRPFCLITMDLDRFKDINDSKGHLIGDAVLQRVGEILQDETREVDLAARIGGDELAVVVTETSSAGASLTAERVRARIERDAQVEGTQATASFGIAEYPRDAGTIQEVQTELRTLLVAADAAMYAAKRAGRNVVRVFNADEELVIPGEKLGLL